VGSAWEHRAGPYADPVITCIDCLGPAYLLTTRPPDDPALPGDVVSYRCRDCGERFDLVVPEGENPGPENPGPENPGPENPGPENPGPENPGPENGVDAADAP